MLRCIRQCLGMFVNNRSHNIHKLLDHHKYLGKHEYSYSAKVEVHMNKEEVEAVVVGQVVALVEQLVRLSLMLQILQMKHHS
jgi:hypothetical protein